MPWQWYVNQCFAFVALVLTVLSFIQKSSLKLLIYRNLTNISIFIGLCFIGKSAPMISCGTAVLRNAVALTFMLLPNLKHKDTYKYISGAIITVLLITCNIVFWKNWTNILSMVIGIVNIVAFFQSSAKRIRYISLVGSILLVVQYAIILSPTNVIVNVVGVVSTIVGICKHDIKHKTNNLNTQTIVSTNNVECFNNEVNNNIVEKENQNLNTAKNDDSTKNNN